MFKFLAIFGFLLSIPSSVGAANELIKKSTGEFYLEGSSCDQHPRIILEQTQAQISNQYGVYKSYHITDICFTCVGGAKYQGNEHWIRLKNKDNASFSLRLNADEEIGSLIPMTNVAHEGKGIFDFRDLVKPQKFIKCSPTT